MPTDPEARVRLYGLVNELAAEGGLQWCARLLMIHETFASGGTRSFPTPVSQYLAPKYGYAAERIPAARARILEVLILLEAQRARSAAVGHAYLLGDRPTAADIYLADLQERAEAHGLLDLALRRLPRLNEDLPAQARSALKSRLHRVWGDWHARAGDQKAARDAYVLAQKTLTSTADSVIQNARRGAFSRALLAARIFSARFHHRS